jgi:hypothetical protein
LLVEVPSPADVDQRLWVATDPGEITVGFGSHGWHGHFGEFIDMDEASATAAALEEIADIVSERAVIATSFRDGRAVSSQLLRADAPIDTHRADYVEVVSWRGTHNAIVRAA